MQHLISLGNAERLDSDRMIDQVIALLASNDDGPEPVCDEEIDWKQQLDLLINEM